MTKIIQTFWNASKDDILLNAGGYACPEIHWMSWAFSSLQLRKFYPDVEMYTNNTGKELFELLELPYTKIHTTLEGNEFLENLMPELWAYSKIHTYSIQEEPFLHIDGDVFIWKPFEEKLLNSPLIAQNLEDNMEVYIKMIKTLEKYIPYKPDWLEFMKNHPKAYNAGVIGGTDYNFFKEYAEIARDFYPQNIDAFREMKANNENVTGINLVFEQYLYYVLSAQQNKKDGLFADKAIHIDSENDYFFDIRKIPAEFQYLHFMGGSKKILYFNHYIDYLMQVEYPEHRQKIISVFEQRNMLSPYMKHILSLEKNDRNVNIINPFSIHKPLENRIDGIALVKKDASEVNICKCLKNSFFEIAKQDNSFLAKHPILKEVSDYQKAVKSFFKQNFNKFTTPQNDIFAFYKGAEDIFRSEDFLQYYMFANPFHDIYITKYNWIEIGTMREEEEDFIISEVQDLMLFYLNLNTNTQEASAISKRSVIFLEEIKNKPTTVGHYIQQKQLNEKEAVKLIEELWLLLTRGIVYFSKSDADFIALPQGTYQLKDILKRHSTQIGKSLQFVLEHYEIANYNKQILSALDNFSFLGVSIGKVLQLVKALNFDAMAIKTDITAIEEIPTPAILLLENENHGDFLYVILTKASNGKVWVYNPETEQEESHTYKRFDKLWSKKLIILKPKS